MPAGALADERPDLADAELGQLLDGEVGAPAAAAEPDRRCGTLRAQRDERAQPHPPAGLELAREDRAGRVDDLEPRALAHAQHALEVAPVDRFELERLAELAGPGRERPVHVARHRRSSRIACHPSSTTRRSTR